MGEPACDTAAKMQPGSRWTNVVIVSMIMNHSHLRYYHEDIPAGISRSSPATSAGIGSRQQHAMTACRRGDEKTYLPGKWRQTAAAGHFRLSGSSAQAQSAFGPPAALAGFAATGLQCRPVQGVTSSVASIILSSRFLRGIPAVPDPLPFHYESRESPTGIPHSPERPDRLPLRPCMYPG